jgi:hypothetical protein
VDHTHTTVSDDATDGSNSPASPQIVQLPDSRPARRSRYLIAGAFILLSVIGAVFAVALVRFAIWNSREGRLLGSWIAAEESLFAGDPPPVLVIRRNGTGTYTDLEPGQTAPGQGPYDYREFDWKLIGDARLQVNQTGSTAVVHEPYYFLYTFDGRVLRLRNEDPKYDGSLLSENWTRAAQDR